MLILADLWAVASGIEVKPEESAPQRLTAFATKDHRALASILMRIKPTQLTLVKTCQTALQEWNKLMRIHGTSKKGHAIYEIAAIKTGR